MVWIWHFGKVASALDVATRLIASERLGIWDSVLVQSQSAGRGQMRRSWFSPPGNIFAALRLPLVEPFASQAAAPAVGCLVAQAMLRMGLKVKIKWPNDIVGFTANNCAVKIAGILLEERAGSLLAGIGVNVSKAPPKVVLREDAALSASCLADIAPEFLRRYPSSSLVWLSLVKRAISIYDSNDFIRKWQILAEDLLLWKQQSVLVKDGNQAMHGKLLGLSLTGELILSCNATQKHCHGGSLALAE